jgi:hypothetical protein
MGLEMDRYLNSGYCVLNHLVYLRLELDLA